MGQKPVRARGGKGSLRFYLSNLLARLVGDKTRLVQLTQLMAKPGVQYGESLFLAYGIPLTLKSEVWCP